jgi:two-component system, chemotaxis family, chemotaxis protein CheY
MASILLIETENALRRSIAGLLAAGGHEVHEARDGREGLRLLQSQRPDIILTDIVMPHADGIEVIAANRRLSPPAKLVAMHTGCGLGPDYLKAALELGADRALKKPFRPAELEAAIAACVTEDTPARRYA